MKKLFALLSLTAFLAVAVNAQTTESAPAAKKETVAKSESKTPACCAKANPACCKNNKMASKECTPEQRAACAKAGGTKECNHDHAKMNGEKVNPSGTR
jgi:hypothetical protein